MNGRTPPYHHGDVRAAAVRCTMNVVRRDGELAVTIRSIAEEIGVTHAALYRHVRSVDELFDEVAADFLRRLVGDADHDEPVATFLERYAALAVADPNLYRLAFRRVQDRERAPSSVAALRSLRLHAGRVFAASWPDDTKTGTMHRVIRTWSTLHGMLDLASMGLVVVDRPEALVRYLVRSALPA